MNFSFKRSDRVRDLILREVSKMITQGEVKDPRLSGAVITSVKLSDDMGHAKIFFTPLTEGMETARMKEGFKSSAGFIRAKLAERLKLKRVPKIEFEFDSFLRDTHRVDDIIKDL